MLSSTCYLASYLGNKILTLKHLIHDTPHPMNILIADLHKDASAVCQQLFDDNQPVAEVGEVGVDTEGPCIAVGFDLLPFTG